MLPLNVLLKMPNFNITLNKNAVKVILVEHESQMEAAITELKRLLERLPFVGLDLKTKHTYSSIHGAYSAIYEILVLQVEGYCLLINFKHMATFHTSLSKLLMDNTICFVGLNLDNNKFKWRNTKPFFVGSHGDIVLKTGVNIQFLAARVLKDPSLVTCSLKTLATKNGFDYVECKFEALKEKNLADFCFSDEDVKCMISHAYMSYTLAAFLMNKLT